MEQGNERHIDDDDFRGCSMKEIYRGNKFKLKHVPSVLFSENHTVLYHFPIKDNNFPPRPLKGKWDKWDNSHVRLPCSTKSQYPVTKDDGTVSIESRWDLIQTALLQPIRSSQELENAILSYNSKYKSVWKFISLHTIFNEELTEEDGVIFFDTILPKIINLALRLPELVSTAIPLLKQGENHSISLSQEQISCLLANAFLCTFPRRNTLKKKSEYSTFPSINFNRLYQSTGQSVVEKIKCILHYFRRVCSNTPTGVVTFSRRFVPDTELPSWSDRDDPLGVTPLHISSTGTIEEQGQGLLQVDFANKFLGGGVLGSGCVQEEIRFVICPELIISKLFTEALKPFEALVIVGCEQYSKYSGYASSFTWDGDYKDITPFDDSSRRQCHIVAIDALHFVQSSHQYREELMLRELNKAYVGFYHTLNTPAPGVASGNWGCGAFGGESTLKALLQLMACTVTKRPLVYFTFGDIELRNAIHAMHTYFIENNITVRQLWKYLKQFRSQNLSPNDLYSFICQKHQDSHSILQCCTSSRGMLPNRHSPKKYTEEKTQKKPAKEEIQKNHIEENRNDIQNSKTGNENALSLNESAFAKIKKTTSSERNLNMSRDIFASTSSSDEEKSSAKCDMFDLNTNRSYNIETSSKITGNETSEQDSKDKSPRNKSEPRQRSLLEMLDVLYKDSPAKRHRSANENL